METAVSSRADVDVAADPGFARPQQTDQQADGGHQAAGEIDDRHAAARRRASGSPVTLMKPASAWMRKSYPGSAARGPVLPNPDSAQQTMRGLTLFKLA